jgi:tetratricopeptide (TPR) repeat protein
MRLADGRANRGKNRRVAHRARARRYRGFSPGWRHAYGDWASQFLLGRAYDLCGDDPSAYARYRTAWEPQDDSSLVGTSLAIICMRIGRAPEAVRVLERLRAREPEAVGLMSDHAAALLLCGRLEEALVMAQRALDKRPNDPITGAVLATIELVRAGRLAQPDRWPPNQQSA